MRYFGKAHMRAVAVARGRRRPQEARANNAM
jgi:hypothetical protein